MRVADIAVFNERTQRSQARLLVAGRSAPGRAKSSPKARLKTTAQSKPRWYAQAGIPRVLAGRGGRRRRRVIFQYRLARTADGAAAYVDAGVTTLDALESAPT